MRGLRRVGVLVAAALAVTGCHAHRPGSLADVEPDEHVRVTVSPAAAERIAAQVGPELGRTFSALYLGTDGGQVVLAVPLRDPDPKTATRAVHTRVELPAGDLLAVEVERVVAGRSVLAAVAGAAVAAGSWSLFR